MTRFSPFLAAIALLLFTGCPPDEPVVVDPEPAETVVDVAERAGLATFVELVDAADLRDELSAEGPFSVFAPSDEAFAAIDQDTLDALRSPENRDALRDLLAYHVVEDSLRMADFEAEDAFTSMEGETLTIAGNDEVTVTDAVGNTASLQPLEHEAHNGVVFVIDRVLFHAPPTDLAIEVEEQAEELDDEPDPTGEPGTEVDNDPEDELDPDDDMDG